MKDIHIVTVADATLSRYDEERECNAGSVAKKHAARKGAKPCTTHNFATLPCERSKGTWIQESYQVCSVSLSWPTRRAGAIKELPTPSISCYRVGYIGLYCGYFGGHGK